MPIVVPILMLVTIAAVGLTWVSMTRRENGSPYRERERKR